MILADTSIWVDHLRGTNAHLRQLLMDARVLMHPFVIGEIACGNLQKRSSVLSGLQQLPTAVSAEHEEVLQLLDQHRLNGTGITWTDAHLLASALLTGCRLWTLDTCLRAAATQLRLLYSRLM